MFNLKFCKKGIIGSSMATLFAVASLGLLFFMFFIFFFFLNPSESKTDSIGFEPSFIEGSSEALALLKTPVNLEFVQEEKSVLEVLRLFSLGFVSEDQVRDIIDSELRSVYGKCYGFKLETLGVETTTGLPVEVTSVLGKDQLENVENIKQKFTNSGGVDYIVYTDKELIFVQYTVDFSTGEDDSKIILRKDLLEVTSGEKRVFEEQYTNYVVNSQDPTKKDIVIELEHNWPPSVIVDNLAEVFTTLKPVESVITLPDAKFHFAETYNICLVNNDFRSCESICGVLR